MLPEPNAAQHGTVREKLVREIAGRLGVADFVYHAPAVSKGSGSREASGDGLLMVGDRGVILQVKARIPARAVLDSDPRVAAWIRKNASEGLKQGRGTRRELLRRQALGEPIAVGPVRAADLPPHRKCRFERTVTQSLGDWPIAVVVDHPKSPQLDLGFESDAVYLTLEDWLQLNRVLRSTRAVVEYIRLVLQRRAHVRLGCEAERYRSMLGLSHDDLSQAGVDLALPRPEDVDELGTDLYRDVLDKVWPEDGIVPWQSADDYRSIVEFLDTVAPSLQSGIGRWFLQKRAAIANGQRVASGTVQLGSDRLVYACSNKGHWRDEHDWGAEFGLLTAVRHLQALESGAGGSTVTLGAGALVSDSGAERGVAYTFVLLRGSEGSLPMPPELRSYCERQYGVHDHARRETVLPHEP